ncbi:MAG: CapA family protein, partial [Candidatus Berkiella sp.]
YQQNISKRYGGSILEKYGYTFPLEQVKPIKLRADFVIANLETPITDIDRSPFEGIKEYLHWTDVKKAPSTLINHNISLLSLANNHTFDYGKKGFEQTLNILENYSIPVIGAGKDINEAGEPFLVELNFEEKIFKIAIIGAFEDLSRYRNKYEVYAEDKKPGLMPLNLDDIANQISKLREEDPELFIILYPHWGSNYSWREDEQIKISNELINCGIDLIIGHGAHMIQEVERTNGKWIIFSIGNFMFNSPGRYEKLKAPPYSFVVSLNILHKNNKFEIYLKLYPILTDNKLTNYQTRFLSHGEFAHFLDIFAPRILIKQPKPSDIDIKKDEIGFYIELPVLNHQIIKTTVQTKWIGMVYHESLKNDSENHIYPWIARAFVIDRELEKHDYKLICFTPRNFNSSNNTVTGFMLEHGQFKPITVPIPKVIYNFHIGKAERHLYREFESLALKLGVEIYPTLPLRKLTSDKLQSAKLVVEFDSNLIPKTEHFEGDASQLQSYLDLYKSVFIKPRFGNMGNDIYVLKKDNHNYRLAYYFKGKRTEDVFNDLSKCADFINKNINDKEYIIQQTIDIPQYNGSVYNIRSIVFLINSQWRFLSELIVSEKGKDVTNLYQGGNYQDTKSFLYHIFPANRAPIILKRIETTSIEIAKFIGMRFENKINEIAFDILIDKDENLYLAELNVKPGLAGEPMKYSNYFLMTEGENHTYETLTVKHGEYLAKSLLDRCHPDTLTKTTINKKYWFENITSNTLFTHEKMNLISEMIFDALISRQYKIENLPIDLQIESPQLIFLTISDDNMTGIKYLGRGGSLLEAINDVMQKIFDSQPTDIQALKIDIVEEVTVLKSQDIRIPFSQDRSLYGIAFDEKLEIAYLPEEIVTKTIINNDELLKLNSIFKSSKLSSSQKNVLSKSKSITIYRFKLQSYFISNLLKALLYRGHRIFEQINTNILYETAVMAGNYLQAAVKDDGKFAYEYLPKKDVESDRYNVLRHAGSVYSMLELYELTKNQLLMDTINLALTNLINRAKPISIKGEELLCIVEKDFAKLGANALTLLSLSKYMLITKDSSYLSVARKLALWIKHVQANSGQFLIHKYRFSKKSNTDFVSGYYPGEAIFSLALFYQVDPDPIWLDTAIKAANYIINVRDKNKKISQLEHDHWLLYGLNELYPLNSDSNYIKHTLKICQAIINSQYKKSEPPDYLGSYYNPPRSTPAAVRTEGLCAAHRLLSSLKYDNESKEILKTIKLNIRFQLQTQFHPERALYFKNPKRTLGGFSRSLTDYSIRIDYVQHNLSSIIGLYKILI